MKKTVLMLCGLILLSGCNTRLLDFTIMSSKNVDLSKASTFKRDSKRVEGRDKASIIIIIPTGTPNAKEAMDRAIESVPGAIALVDGVLTHKMFYIPYIYGESTYVVEGTALIDPALVASVPEHGMYIITRMAKDGSVKESKVVTEQEYDKVRENVLSLSKG